MNTIELLETPLARTDLDDNWNALPDKKGPGAALFDEMVMRQYEQYGSLSEPCSEADELLKSWNEDTKENALPHWQAAVARFEAKSNVINLREPFAREQAANDKDEPADVSGSDTDEPGDVPQETESVECGADENTGDDAVLINDAEVLGVESAEMVELLKKPVVFMTGELWDQGDRRNTRPGDWKRNEMTWGDLLTHPKSPLTNHVESGNKQGRSIVLGETIDGNRNAESVKSLHAVVIDIDSGPKVDDVIAKLEELSLFALVYTSFNHNKAIVTLKHDDVVCKLKLQDTPNRTQVVEYLRSHHKDRYDEDFLEEIKIKDARHHGPKGLQIILETPPLHKFRIVIPLREPVDLADLGTTATQWKAAWADIVTGFVVNELGVSFDATSCDVNRLFYTPRHPKGGEWDCVLIMGEPLNVDDITPHSKDAYVKNRDNDPFAYGLGGDDDEPPICLTPKGKSLNEIHRKVKGRLLLPDLIIAEAPDKVRREVSEGKIEIECPFEHEHSTEGGTGTVVMDPQVNEYEVWSISCPHDACQGRHKLEFLEEMLKAGWFPEELLTDPEYLLGAEDDDEEIRKFCLPTGFALRNDKYCSVEVKDDKKVYTPLCQEFEVIGRASNPEGNAGAGRIIQFKNENGVTVEITLDRSRLFKNDGGGVLDELADAGMGLQFRGPKGRGLFLDLLRGLKSETQIPIVPRPGWTRDRAGKITGYMLPTGKYIKANDCGPDMRLHSNGAVKDRGTMGELEEWQEAASAAQQNTHWVLGLCGGFAGVLVDMLEMQTCGINLSGHSAKGKTISLMLGTSIWATPKNGAGLLFVMNSTANAVEDILTKGSGAMCGLDEIGAMQNPRALGPTLFGASSGSGKNRKEGRGAGLAETAEFRTFVLMTHEHSLKSTIQGAGGDYKAGLSVRFPDVDVTENVTVSEDVLGKLGKATNNFGHAGPAFVNYLLQERWHRRTEVLKARISATANGIAGENAAPALRRAATVFALVQVAGELAVEAGIIPDRIDPANAIGEAFKIFAKSDEGRATSGGDDLVDDFRSWITRSYGNSIIAADSADEPGFPHRVGWYTETHVILDYGSLSNMKSMGLEGKRETLLAALNKLGAIYKSGRNNYHNSLPADVDFGSGPSERKVKNVRILREKLGV